MGETYWGAKTYSGVKKYEKKNSVKNRKMSSQEGLGKYSVQEEKCKNKGFLPVLHFTCHSNRTLAH